jgi:hypothetical protein
VTVNIALARTLFVPFGLIANELTDDDFVLEDFWLLVADMITDVIYASQEHSANEEVHEECLWFIEQCKQQDHTNNETEDHETFVVNWDSGEGLETVHHFLLINTVIIRHLVIKVKPIGD